ncbi:hypothetical protein ACNF40_08190 [Cuniculiplasma sp. SKW4]|uniref:hypothetical protein n=1 Tax=Cuniculiplasma sp. SKW4 TaxID=3400171 RepID=UPI003FD00967
MLLSMLTESSREGKHEQEKKEYEEHEQFSGWNRHMRGEEHSDIPLPGWREVKDSFKIDMKADGYNEFASMTPRETMIASDESGSAYVVDRTLRELGYEYITVANTGNFCGLSDEGRGMTIWIA